MSNVSPRRWFRFRFSVRTLLLAITLFCAWLAYQVHWLHQRHAFLELHVGRLLAVQGVSESRLAASSAVLERYSQDRGPGLLWVLGEKQVDNLTLLIPEHDVTSHDGLFWMSRSQADFQRAKQLFPEAYVDPILWKQSGPVSLVQIQIAD